jgi:hypothetical protein
MGAGTLDRNFVHEILERRKSKGSKKAQNRKKFQQLLGLDWGT